MFALRSVTYSDPDRVAPVGWPRPVILLAIAINLKRTRLRLESLHRRVHMSRTESGFTLVELVIAILILAILIGMALPNFSSTMRSNRIATHANEFIASVSLARSEAIKNNVGAGICASPDGAVCGTDWNAGWIVFSDLNGSGAFNAGDAVLRASSGSTSMSFTTPTAGGTLMFNNRGIYTGAVNTTFVMTPTDCPASYIGKRGFSLLITGQLSMQKQVCP